MVMAGMEDILQSMNNIIANNLEVGMREEKRQQWEIMLQVRSILASIALPL